MAYRAILATIIMLTAGTIASAQNYGPPGWPSPEPNYYAMPADTNGLTAAMYPCPRPTPPLIGQTYITYGPLDPQQFMYLHYNFYETCYGPGQRTSTSVTYGHHHHLWPHPSLRGQGPGLHTPTNIACKM